LQVSPPRCRLWQINDIYEWKVFENGGDALFLVKKTPSRILHFNHEYLQYVFPVFEAERLKDAGVSECGSENISCTFSALYFSSLVPEP
jgi:hypothetical protein